MFRNYVELNITIFKSIEIVSHAIFNSIPAFKKSADIKRVIYSEENRKFILILLKDCYHNNFSIIQIVLELKKVKSHTLLFATINYKAKRNNKEFYLRQYFFENFYLKRLSNIFLTDFKKRLEKWL